MTKRRIAAALALCVMAMPLYTMQYGLWRFNTPDGLPHALAEQCLNAAREGHSRLSEYFPVLNSIPITFVLLKGRLADRGSPYAGGYYFPATRSLVVQHVPLLLEQGRLHSIIAHELVHAALAGLGRHPLPLWLEEGCAVYFSGEHIDVPPLTVPRPASLAELDALLEAAASHPDFDAWQASRTYYQQARSLITYLVNRGGVHNVIAMVSAVKQGLHVDVALNRYFGIFPETLEARLAR